MRTALRRHPVTTRLFGIGIPGWVGLVAAGWPLALLVTIIAVVIFAAWRAS